MKLFRSQDVFWGPVDGKMVICDGLDGKFFTLNNTAALLWDACEGASLDSLVARLATNFPGQDVNVLRADTMRFVERMRSKGLLKIEERST